MGRPSLYTEELADEICDYLADGYSLVTISKLDDMPGLRTMMDWASDNADFRTKYTRAREAQAEVMDHKIEQAAEDADKDNAAAQRVKVDAYKWRAAKLAPKRYGDKIDHTLAGPDGGPIQTIRRVVVDPGA